MKNFVLIGAAGYIAPRHMKAIKETGNNLIAAVDPHDAVGILDQYFPECDFFTEFERFDRHCEKLKRQGTKIDYVVVCSPNYLHDAHIRFGLRIGADVICEKPVVLNPWNLDALIEMEKETGKKVFVVHQLRYHPAITALHKEIKQDTSDKEYEINISYITPRGKWYQYSWKGNEDKSGGVITNIGLHFFDLLLWLFGEPAENTLLHSSATSASGTIHFQQAKVKWKLSIDALNSGSNEKLADNTAIRLLNVNGKDIDLNGDLSKLHTVSYQHIFRGQGIGLAEAKNVTSLLYAIRKQRQIK
ncbi:MAG: Gfo/Idh/MocA family oxidoreductase [Sphingobacteriales bacterium]|nr:Gfo/Idh/MocA family oxidoreductase [Sphingobacteriales bacterium]